MYPTYRFCNKYAEPLAASQGVRSAISEKKFPKSLSSAYPALSTMSAQVLAQHCIKEIGNYRTGEPLVEEVLDSNELWELLLDMFPNQQEKRLMYLLYHCGLKPREIMRHCPQEFSDVQHVYRLRRYIMERLLRNVDQLRWRLGADTKDC